MSVVEEVGTGLPTGTWKLDPVHSSVGFAVKHNLVATFRGSFDEFDASLADGRLEGVARVASIAVDEPNLKGHLLTPEFIDASAHPELRFVSGPLQVEGSTIDVEGTLTVKGVTRPVRLTGTVTGPVADAYGGTRLGIDLETTVDRREFGLDWNAPLPGGGFVLANEVKLRGELELVEER
jgi:polyisoprenoid-binding protein YceI